MYYFFLLEKHLPVSGIVLQVQSAQDIIQPTLVRRQPERCNKGLLQQVLLGFCDNIYLVLSKKRNEQIIDTTERNHNSYTFVGHCNFLLLGTGSELLWLFCTHTQPTRSQNKHAVGPNIYKEIYHLTICKLLERRSVK